jgi:hypothetical protein
MKKAEAIEHWNDTPKDQNVLKYFTPLESNAKGSTYGACGIRICGNSKFIDAVMSRLKDVVDAENAVTRLNLSRAEVKPTEINGETKSWQNAATGNEVVYIQIRMRGDEGSMTAGFDSRLRESTERYEAAIS